MRLPALRHLLPPAANSRKLFGFLAAEIRLRRLTSACMIKPHNRKAIIYLSKQGRSVCRRQQKQSSSMSTTFPSFAFSIKRLFFLKYLQWKSMVISRTQGRSATGTQEESIMSSMTTLLRCHRKRGMIGRVFPLVQGEVRGQNTYPVP